jgi:CubicO group peptidase (beta-lactamase class C family)
MCKTRNLTSTLFMSLILFITSCITTPSPQPKIIAPTPNYDAHGVDLARLDLMTDVIEDMDLPIDSVVVLRHGELVFETYPNPDYGPDDTHLLYSVTKSFTSALIGIAIEQGYIEGIDQKVVDFFPDWDIENLDSRKEDLTIEDLLTMTCGFEWVGPDDGLHTWGDANRSGNPVKFVLNQPMATDPGSEWLYNGGCSHLLSAILTRTTGIPTLDYAREVLFEPLGIWDVRWPRDPQGIYYGGQDIWLMPRDMAKFGQLFLDQGVWEGEQIIPAAWVAESTETHLSTLGGGYGYQWWTYPDCGIYYASGAFEQRIMVLPDHDLVVVFTSDPGVADLSSGRWGENPPTVDWLLGRFILPAVDTYAMDSYAAYGFSLEIPLCMQARELGKGWQGDASDISGMIQFHYGGSPFESLGVQWDKVADTPDPGSALDDFALAVQAMGVVFNQQGDRLTLLMGDHEVLYQSFDIKEGEYTYPGLVGAWYCETSQRTFIIYYATTPGLAQEQHLLWQFLSILESFNCDV